MPLWRKYSFIHRGWRAAYTDQVISQTPFVFFKVLYDACILSTHCISHIKWHFLKCRREAHINKETTNNRFSAVSTKYILWHYLFGISLICTWHKFRITKKLRALPKKIRETAGLGKGRLLFVSIDYITASRLWISLLAVLLIHTMKISKLIHFSSHCHYCGLFYFRTKLLLRQAVGSNKFTTFRQKIA